VEAVQWRKGVGEVRLVGGLVTPVSRSYGPALKAAGWF
jgi:DNA-binding LytR/AlgR family response regulator